MERAVGVAPPALDSRVARWTLVASILGSSLAFIDGSVVNVALPAIQGDLGGGLATQQWVVNAYLLTLGSLILVGGSLGDIFGESRVFAIGVASFAGVSLLCAIAPNAPALIVFRGLQGMAGALLTPASLAMLTAAFIGGLACLGAFVAFELRTPMPMLPLRLFRLRNFSITNVETLAVYGGLSALSTFLTLFLIEFAGYSALHAGLSLLPITLVMFFLSPRMGRLSMQYGPRLFMSLSPAIAGAAVLAFVRLPE